VSRTVHRRSRARLALAAALAAALAGCGYEVITYPKDRGASNTIAIQDLVNDSSEPGFEFMLSDALRKEFARRGAMRVVNSLEGASYIVTGYIPSINTGRRSFSSVVLALEYEVTVRLDLTLERPGTPIGFDGRGLSESDLYLASADVEATRKNRQEALRRIAAVLAVRIHDLLVEVAPPEAPASPVETAVP
jgi:hypothetical protein